MNKFDLSVDGERMGSMYSKIQVEQVCKCLEGAEPWPCLRGRELGPVQRSPTVDRQNDKQTELKTLLSTLSGREDATERACAVS